MSISFVAVSISDGATKNVGPKPTGTADNDIMLAHVWAYDETVTAAPTGWTLLESQTTSDVPGGTESFNSYLYIKEAGAAEPADYTWTTTTATGPTPNRRVVIVSYRECLLSGPTSEDRATHTENAGANTLSLPNMNTGAVGRRLVLLAAVGTLTPTATIGSPWVQRLDEDGQFVFDRRIAVAGTVTSSPLTISTIITSWGFEVMLVAEPDAPGDRDYCQSVDTQIN